MPRRVTPTIFIATGNTSACLVIAIPTAWCWVRRARKEKHEFSDEVKVVV